MTEFNNTWTLAKATKVGERIGVSESRVAVYEEYDNDGRSADVEAFAEALRFLRDNENVDSVTVDALTITRNNEFNDPDDVTVVPSNTKPRETSIETLLDTIETAAERYVAGAPVTRAVE